MSIGLAVTSMYVGVARAAQEFFNKFAHERVPSALGKPIAQTERIQTIAGEIEAQLWQAEEVIYSLARRADEGDEDGVCAGAVREAARHPQRRHRRADRRGGARQPGADASQPDRASPP